MDRKAIGRQIHNLRRAKGWSLRELGQRAGVSFSHLAAIERGTSLPSLEYLEALSKALDVSISTLLANGERVRVDLKMALRDPRSVVTYGDRVLSSLEKEELSDVVESVIKFKDVDLEAEIRGMAADMEQDYGVPISNASARETKAAPSGGRVFF